MDYQKHTFPNGLRLITIPMPSLASVTVLIMVGVGSRFEEKEINGISHFLEHMAFKGTKKRPTALAISSLIDGIGGEFNAFTIKDHTGFYIKAAVKHLPLTLDVLSDMLLYSKFDPMEIEKERGVIIEEINMYEDTPIKKIGDLYENLLYGDTKLGRDIAGRKEAIKKVKREDFLSYINSFYSPANTIVTIAGGITESVKDTPGESWPTLALRPATPGVKGSVKSLVEKYLGGWKPKKVVQPDIMPDGQKEPAVLVRYKDTNQAHLCLGVRSYHLAHPSRFALGVLTALLGGGMSSRLFIQVRERRGLAYYIHSTNEMYQDVGNFVTQAGIDVVRIGEAIAVILEEFKKATAEKVKEEELTKAKEFLKGRFTLELEDSKSVASLFAGSWLLEDKIRTPDEIMMKIDEVTPFDVKKVACDIFKEETLNLAIIGPYKDEERFRKILKLT